MVFHFRTFFDIWRLVFTRPYLSVGGLLFYTTLFLIIFTILIFSRILQAFDMILFPAYRKTEVKEPIFIIAPPRSGTTFLHRVMSEDDQFTYIKLYQMLFTAISAYKFFAWLGSVDAIVGRPLGRIVDLMDRLWFGGWDDVHKAGWNASEEDEVWWMLTLYTPAAIIFFPFLMLHMRYINHLDREPDPILDRMASYFRDCLQRHVYATGTNKTLLAKNALAAGRLRTYLRAVPDARIIHLVRHPYESVASTMSMFSMPWKIHSPRFVGNTPENRALGEMNMEFYETLIELKKELPPEKIVEVRYEDLLSDPKRAVETIYDHFGLELSDEFRDKLALESKRARGYKSGHSYDLASYGMTRDMIYEAIPEVFEHYSFSRDH